MSYLIPKGHKIPVAKYFDRTSPDNPKKLSVESVRYSHSHSSLHFDGQIVGLISNNCMSSNEYFIMGLESLKHHLSFFGTERVTLVGDSTFGSSGNPKEFKHSSGIRYTIPSWVCYTSRGELLEGNGVHPDIHIKSSSTISWGKDKAFETAVKFLHSK